MLKTGSCLFKDPLPVIHLHFKVNLLWGSLAGKNRGTSVQVDVKAGFIVSLIIPL